SRCDSFETSGQPRTSTPSGAANVTIVRRWGTSGIGAAPARCPSSAAQAPAALTTQRVAEIAPEQRVDVDVSVLGQQEAAVEPARREHGDALEDLREAEHADGRAAVGELVGDVARDRPEGLLEGHEDAP